MFSGPDSGSRGSVLSGTGAGSWEVSFPGPGMGIRGGLLSGPDSGSRGSSFSGTGDDSSGTASSISEPGSSVLSLSGAGTAGSSVSPSGDMGGRSMPISTGKKNAEAIQKTAVFSPGSLMRKPSISERGRPSGNERSDTGRRTDTVFPKQVSVAICVPVMAFPSL